MKSAEETNTGAETWSQVLLVLVFALICVLLLFVTYLFVFAIILLPIVVALCI